MTREEILEVIKTKRSIRNAFVVSIDAEIRALLEQVKADCDHPEEWRHTFKWEHDDGYGSQSWQEGQRCSICHAEKHWASSSLWSTPA